MNHALDVSAGGADRCFDEATAAQMARLVTDLGRMYHERNEALQQVVHAHHEALLQLSLAVELKGGDGVGHMTRVGYLSETLALCLGTDGSYAHTLRKIVPMHDVGHIGVPDQLLRKPEHELCAQERHALRRHTTVGAEILGKSHIPLFQQAAEIARAHHERFDGDGYPDGLTAHNIPLAARITAVVDFFDVLTTRCARRPVVSDALALKRLQAERGKALDPIIVDTFIANAAQMIDMRERVNRRNPSFADLMGAVQLGSSL